MPNLIAATPQDLHTVRVVFDGALADLSTGANGALNLDNWSFGGQVNGQDPIASTNTSAIIKISTTTLDIIVGQEFSPGRTYQVTAKAASEGGITGVADDPNNRVAFDAMAADKPADRDFSVLEMIPRMNFRQDDTDDLTKFLKVIQDPVTIMLAAVDKWTTIFDYDLASENFVDLLLQDLGYPFEIELTLVDKRRLLSVLVTMYKQKGTVQGIKNAIRFFVGYESDVLTQRLREWGWILEDSELDYDTILGDTYYYDSTIYGSDIAALFNGTATPYDFIVKVGTPNAVALTAAEVKKITAVVNYMKPAHTHMISLTECLPPPTNPSAAGGTGQITVSWDAVTSAVKYAIFSSLFLDVSPVSPGGVLDPNNASPFVDSGLTAGTKKYYVVCAQGSNGINGVASAVVNGTAT